MRILEIDITDLKEPQIEELKKFHKSYFDIQSIVTSASELKYTNEIKSIINSEIKNPSEPFIKLFASQVYVGRITDKVVFQFSDLVKKSFQSLIHDIINERLKTALSKEEIDSLPTEPANTVESTDQVKEKIIDTTQEEIEAYFIIKSILRPNVESTRITYRDTQTYFIVMLDDNVRKVLCRLYMNGKKKYIGLIDTAKKEIKSEITSLDDIYNYAEIIKNTLDTYIAIN